jgi:hypothetical protein
VKIIAKVPGENQSLVKALTERGIAAKLVRNGVIIELQCRQNGSGDSPDLYELPPEANSAILHLDVTEEGGGMTNTGSGTVVCGMSGKSLRPYFTPRSGSLACGKHAYFSVPNCCVTITGYRGSNAIVVNEHRIIVAPGSDGGQVARIETEELWHGEAPTREWKCASCGVTFVEERPDKHNDPDGSACYGSPVRNKLALPQLFNRFQAAAMAAHDKSNCYHCREVHYATMA